MSKTSVSLKEFPLHYVGFCCSFLLFFFSSVYVCVSMCEWHESERRPFASASHQHIVKAADESFWRRSFSHIPPITVPSLTLSPSRLLSLFLTHTKSQISSFLHGSSPTTLPASPPFPFSSHLPPPPSVQVTNDGGSDDDVLPRQRLEGGRLRRAVGGSQPLSSVGGEPSAPVTLILEKKSEAGSWLSPEEVWELLNYRLACSSSLDRDLPGFQLGYPRCFSPYASSGKGFLVLGIKKGHWKCRHKKF